MLLRCESLEPPMSQSGQKRPLPLGAARPLPPSADMSARSACESRTQPAHAFSAQAAITPGPKTRQRGFLALPQAIPRTG